MICSSKECSRPWLTRMCPSHLCRQSNQKESVIAELIPPERPLHSNTKTAFREIDDEVNTSEATIVEPVTALRAKCSVRPAKVSDMAALSAIYADAVDATSHTFEIEAPDEIEMTRRWRATLDRDLPYLVAELEGYVVGYSYASQYRPRQG